MLVSLSISSKILSSSNDEQVHATLIAPDRRAVVVVAVEHREADADQRGADVTLRYLP